MYHVYEIFYSFQGEGLFSGRPAVFCRFSGCNLWSGREEDRAIARCGLCDSNFFGFGQGGGHFANAKALARQILAAFPTAALAYATKTICLKSPYVILTGGEPALQVDAALVDCLHENGCMVGIETNGSLDLPEGLDWVCVAPKANVALAVTKGDELKLVWPQNGLDPESFATLDFTHFVMQPLDSGNQARNQAALTMVKSYCLERPHWRLGVQLHKLLGFQ